MGVLAGSMEIIRIENYCNKKNKQKKGKENTNIVLNMDKIM